jgi:four helix bundle protein
MARTEFENLRVHQLAQNLADTVWEVVQRWNVFARDTVGKQLVRAVDGIGANLAEGTGRGRYKDNRRFVRIARGSLYETKHWLRRAFRRRLLDRPQIEPLRNIVDELTPKLNAYLNSIGRRGLHRPAIDN